MRAADLSPSVSSPSPSFLPSLIPSFAVSTASFSYFASSFHLKQWRTSPPSSFQDSASLASNQAAGIKTGFGLPGECLKAAEILKAFLADPASPKSALNAIPKAVLLNAKGLAIFSVVKAGFIFSGKGGTGVIVARLPDGSWSAPSLLMTGGVGWGLQAGADVTVRTCSSYTRLQS